MTAHVSRRTSGGSVAAASRRAPTDQDREPPIRVLLVEDAPAEAELAIRQLKKGGVNCECLRVETQERFTAALQEFRPDVILSDFTLPQFSGPSALKVARELARDIPFIFVSGTI